MGCNCKSNGKSPRHNVMVDGKSVFTTTNKHTALAVARRYPGATVEEEAPAAKTTS